MGISFVVSGTHCFLGASITLDFYNLFFSPFTQGSLSPEEGKDLMKIFNLKLSVPRSLALLYIVQLWVSVFVSIYCREKLFW